MALISISGVGGKKKKKEGAQKGFSQVQIKRTSKSTPSKKQKRQAKVKNAKKKILAKIKKAGKIAIKYNPLVATARNAFLLIVQVNFLNLAKKLNILLVKNPKKLMKFWTGLSGNFGSLQKAINSGKNRKAILGAVAIATTAATATPILIKVQKFLQENGITGKDILDVVKPIVAKAVDKATQKAAEKQVAKEEGEEVEEEEEETTTNNSAPEESDTEDTENEQVGYYC
jgi:hypothetical protein